LFKEIHLVKLMAAALAVSISILSIAVRAQTRHEFFPKYHSRVFSAFKDPVLRINSGDTVFTRTWDSGGRDHEGVWHIQHPYVYPESGNPLTGPFYIEGAEYGDMLEVRLDKVRLNRPYGYTAYRLGGEVVLSSTLERGYKPHYKEDAVRPGRADLIPWDLDLKRGVASPRMLEGSGLQWELPVRPMLGCIGVAPPGERVETSGPSGVHGGNMDYNEVVEGATLYFPVFHTGAYLYVGDGHALQADGEGLGSGVETSMDVEFTVRVHKGKRIGLPRLENAEFIVSIANGTNFDRSLRSANSDMIAWLTRDYGVTEPEAHLLIGTVAQHEIVLDAGSVATAIPKKRLARPR
jgi:amidase